MAPQASPPLEGAEAGTSSVCLRCRRKSSGVREASDRDRGLRWDAEWITDQTLRALVGHSQNFGFNFDCTGEPLEDHNHMILCCKCINLMLCGEEITIEAREKNRKTTWGSSSSGFRYGDLGWQEWSRVKRLHPFESCSRRFNCSNSLNPPNNPFSRWVTEAQDAGVTCP